MAQQLSRFKRQHDTLFESIRSSGVLKPKLTAATILSYAIALLLHSVTLIFLGLTLYNFAQVVIAVLRGRPWELWTPLLWGLLFLVIFWGLRPRLGKFPQKWVLERAETPELYKLVDQVAQKLAAKPIDGIMLTRGYTASFARTGIRNRSVLSLGVPLWAALNPQERIAMIAHEIGHDANGDATNGFILHAALQNLTKFNASVWESFQPRNPMRDWRGREMKNGAVIFAMPLVIVTDILLWAYRRLVFNHHQKAEYYADTQAARIAGKDAMLMTLTKVSFGEDFTSFNDTLKKTGKPANQLFPMFNTYMNGILSDPEKLQKHELGIQDNADIYSWSHPPIPYRKQIIEQYAPTTSEISLSDADIQKLDAELTEFLLQTQATLMRRSDD